MERARLAGKRSPAVGANVKALIEGEPDLCVLWGIVRSENKSPHSTDRTSLSVFCTCTYVCVSAKRWLGRHPANHRKDLPWGWVELDNFQLLLFASVLFE